MDRFLFYEPLILDIMRKYSIVLILLIYGLYGGLISCNKKDQTENRLVGIWESAKIDTLVQYIKPFKPNTFRSDDYKNSILAISADGSFQMVDSTDTITGTWNQSFSDSLIVSNIIHRKYHDNMRIEFVDKNNLTISHSYGKIYAAVGSGYSVEENTLYYIKMYFIRK